MNIIEIRVLLPMMVKYEDKEVFVYLDKDEIIIPDTSCIEDIALFKQKVREKVLKQKVVAPKVPMDGFKNLKPKNFNEFE